MNDKYPLHNCPEHLTISTSCDRNPKPDPEVLEAMIETLKKEVATPQNVSGIKKPRMSEVNEYFYSSSSGNGHLCVDGTLHRQECGFISSNTKG